MRMVNLALNVIIGKGETDLPMREFIKAIITSGSNIAPTVLDSLSPAQFMPDVS